MMKMGKKILLVLKIFITLFLFSTLFVAGGSPVKFTNHDFILVWGDSVVNTPQYVFGNNTNTFTALADFGGDLGADIEEVVIAQKRSFNEKMILVSDTSNDLNAFVWDGSTFTFVTELTSSLGTPDSTLPHIRIFDAAYETQSGDLIAVYGDSSNDDFFYHNIYSGGSFQGQVQGNDDLGNGIEWLELEPNPRTDEMILMVRDSTDVLYSYIWNGSAFANQLNLGTMDGSDERGFDAAWLNSTLGIIAWDTNGITGEDEKIHTIQWDSSNYINQVNHTNTSTYGGEWQFIELESHPIVDKIRGVATESSSGYIFEFNSSLDIVNFTVVSTDVSTNNPTTMDIVFYSDTDQWAYFYPDQNDFYFLNLSMSNADEVIISTFEPLAIKGAYDRINNFVAIGFMEGTADIQTIIWDIDAGTFSSETQHDSTTEILSAFDIQYNQYEGIRIFENATLPSNPIWNSVTQIFANVSDTFDELSEVNFTVTTPNGTRVIDNLNASSGGGSSVYWNSSTFTIGSRGNQDIGEWIWTVNATGSSTLSDSGTFVIQNNTQPTIANVTITPTSPGDTDTLTCSADGSTDTEGDTLINYFQFGNSTTTFNQTVTGDNMNFTDEYTGGPMVFHSVYHQAYEITASSRTFPASKDIDTQSEFDDTQYNNISTLNGTYFETSQSNTWTAHKLSFLVPLDIDELNDIEISVTGGGIFNVNNGFEIHIWKDDSSEWVSVTSTTSSNILFNLTGTISGTGLKNSYIDSENRMYFISGPRGFSASTNTIRTDYAELVLDYDTNFTTTSTLDCSSEIGCVGGDIISCTVKVFDTFSFGGGNQTNVSIQSSPVINSNATIPLGPLWNNVTVINANVTDDDGDITQVLFTVITPNGSTIINSVNGTNYASDLWNSSSFTIGSGGLTDIGEWNFTVNATDTGGRNTTSIGNFTVLNLNPTWGAVDDPSSINEDSGLNDNIIANNTLNNTWSDIEEPDYFNTAFITSQTGSSIVSCSVDSDNNVDCTTQANQSGTNTITMHLMDSSGGNSSSQTINIVVNEVNDAPTTTGIPNNETDEDTSFEWNLSSYISDIDSQDSVPGTINISSITLNDTTLATLSTNNDTLVVTVNPSANATGTIAFNFSFIDRDGTGLQLNVSWINFTINAINDVPQILPVADFSLDEDFGTSNIDLTANETDVESSGAGLNWTLTSNDTNIVTITVIDVTLDEFQFVSLANVSGSVNITLNLTDGGENTTSSFILTVNPINDPPTISTLFSPENNSNIGDTTPTLRWTNATDIDGGALTYGVQISNSSGFEAANISYTASSIAEGAIDCGSNTCSQHTVTTTLTDNTYYWRVNTSDGINQTDYSVFFQFTLDGSIPSISDELTHPPLASNIFINTTVYVNATISDTSLDTVILESDFNGSFVNYTSGITNTSDNYTFRMDFGNWSNQQVVQWRYRANDSINNVAIGTMQSFTIQNRVPRCTLNAPANDSTQTSSTVTLSVIPDDDDNDNVNVTFYGASAPVPTDVIDSTTNQANGTTFNFDWTDRSDGVTYYWRARCGDTIGDSGFTGQRQFIIDLPSPAPAPGGGGGGGGTSTGLGGSCTKDDNCKGELICLLEFDNSTKKICQEKPPIIIVVGNVTNFTIIPPFVNAITIPFEFLSKPNTKWEQTLVSNFRITSCDDIQGKIECEINGGGSKALLSLDLKRGNYFSMREQGQIKIEDINGRIKFVNVNLQIFNPGVRIGSIPLLYIIISAIVGVAVWLIFFRKGKRRFITFRKKRKGLLVFEPPPSGTAEQRK